MHSQTSAIAAALVIAWVIFIISRGELPVYLGILGVGPNAGKSLPCGANALGTAAAGAASNIVGSALTGGG